MFASCAAVLGIATWLTPNPAGTGTHTALGLPACGMLTTTGMPCPSCGMTTATTLAVHGHLLEALHTQPAGALFALLVAMAAVVSGYALITGITLAPLLKALIRPATAVIAAAVVLGAWLYKIVTVTGILG